MAPRRFKVHRLDFAAYREDLARVYERFGRTWEECPPDLVEVRAVEIHRANQVLEACAAEEDDG
jgi:hypothetical protein